MPDFKIKAKFKPAGDQPQAITALTKGLEKNYPAQTLLGVTGSGKTFTIAGVIEKAQLPTLVIAHNKTLAAQLCNEFREFFPDSAVEYFVSYYDYYQPEAYLPTTDTYIEKEAMINQEIDRLRHACTQALLTRRDVIIVASVSAIYGLGSPKEYEKIVLHLKKGQNLQREELLAQLIEMQFERTASDLKRGSFRLRGQVFEIMPVNEEMIYRFEISNRIDSVEMVDPITRQVKKNLTDVWFFPARHYVASPKSRETAFKSIKKELTEQLNFFQKQGKLLEYERLKRRVNYDLAMIKNIGYCNGIENYSRHFENRSAGEPPFTLLDYFKYSTPPSPPLGKGRASKGFLTVIDESHVTVPQIRGMYNGDKARKDVLIEHGFRLPSARDNRPLTFPEFNQKIEQIIFVSATPDEYELKNSAQVAEQIVRPTGLIDPEVIIKPITGRSSVILNEARSAKSKNLLHRRKGILLRQPADQDDTKKTNLSQIEDLMLEIDGRLKQKERVLVTTLTKKMAEDLTDFLQERHIKVKYLHSDIDTLERIEIITALRRGDFDVLVGVNLLREGLDLPEVSLVAILDADKEGFLRSGKSLIQTIGRAARNVNGKVILYADEITGSIKKAMGETARRRKIQLAYNKKHNITPQTIQKNIRNILEEFGITGSANKKMKLKEKPSTAKLDILGDARPLTEIIKEKEKQMKEAAQALEFELAAILRDEIRELKKNKQ